MTPIMVVTADKELLRVLKNALRETHARVAFESGTVQRAADGSFYVFMKHSPPSPMIAVATPGGYVDDLRRELDFFSGYVQGFAGGTWSLIEGTFTCGWRIRNCALKESLKESSPSCDSAWTGMPAKID